MIEQDTHLQIGTNPSSQQTDVLGTLLHRLVDTFQERLKELELKEVKDDFVNGQIYEVTSAINHLQTAYLNCL
jgi:hypothetical protein